MSESLIPVPLTTKILRSNGFNNSQVCCDIFYYKETLTQASQDGEVVLSIQLIQNPESKPGVWEIIGGQFHAHIRYLYQLQHCMKIIGFKKEFALNPMKIYEILEQLNNSFKILSEKRLVHRTINLENILVKYLNEQKTNYIVKLKLT